VTRPPALVGIDTGGTFTDLVAFVGGELRTHKLLSTPQNPALAVIQGLGELLPEDIPKHLTYSTTVATNALLERKGARVLLLTTAGFEDLIEIGRQNRPQLYALEPRRPEPLVPRHLRVGVQERGLHDGNIHAALRPQAVRAALVAVRRLRPDAVAVCLLHSYANPAHERRLAQALAATRLAPQGSRQRSSSTDSAIFCSLSHELVSEYREYERLSTTVINAYVGPLMSRHLAELSDGLGAERFRVLQSNGGAISAQLAAHEAVRTCLSGPAGGVAGAWRVARALGLSQVITFDMGGTSTDVSTLSGGPCYSTEWMIGGLPLKVPAIDIHTVGSGGGSLARVDAGGLLKVGPQSAGADPGPACYGKGTLPTVTDANVVLGRLVPEAFLGGRMVLQPQRATDALRRLGRRLRLSAEATAEGVVRVVNAGMERAIRSVSVERGHDPRQYSLIAFGGAAGQHACDLAAALGMSRVVVPLHPGLLSAWGAAMADVQRDHVHTVRLTAPTTAQVTRELKGLQRLAIRELRAEGIAPVEREIISSVDVRYAGQSHEINVAFGKQFAAAFHAAHRRLYGYADPQRALEIVNIRVLAIGHTRHQTPRRRSRIVAQPPQHHRIHVGGRWRRAALWSREHLPTGKVVHGPATIVEPSATTFVPPGWQARVHATGHLLLERQ
jgi:N-methylhydantoinase A